MHLPIKVGVVPDVIPGDILRRPRSTLYYNFVTNGVPYARPVIHELHHTFHAVRALCTCDILVGRKHNLVAWPGRERSANTGCERSARRENIDNGIFCRPQGSELLCR